MILVFYGMIQALGIDWPVSNPILSDKDNKHPMLEEANINFVYEN